METHRVNEETEDGNYVIEMFNNERGRWDYITTEFSISIASEVISNLNNATGRNCRVLSRRSKNMVLAVAP
jgi:hypothetical protein